MSRAQISLRICSLISAFVVCCLDSVMSLVSVTKISSLMLASVAEQASFEPHLVGNYRKHVFSWRGSYIHNFSSFTFSSYFIDFLGLFRTISPRSQICNKIAGSTFASSPWEVTVMSVIFGHVLHLLKHLKVYMWRSVKVLPNFKNLR